MAQDHQIGSLGDLGVGEHLSPQLGDQRHRPARTGVRDEDGIAPPTRQRARDVAGTDESYAHVDKSTVVPAAHMCAAAGPHMCGPGPACMHAGQTRLALVEKPLLNQAGPLFGRDLDVVRGEEEDLVRDPLHPSVERVGEPAGEVDQAL